MEFLVTASNGVDILIANGRIDTTTAPEFSSKLQTMVQGEQAHLLVDFADVRYVSSIGFRALLIAARALETRAGRLAICSLSPACYRLFELGGFTSMFSIFETRNDALAALTA